MARVLVLTDLGVEDPNWKGAVAWQVILSLVQSQHEVRVLTLADNTQIPFSHSLLTVIQPVKSWSASQLPGLFRGIMTFRPDVIQSFGFKPSRLWPALSVWPALAQFTKIMPRTLRVSTLFEENDCRAKDPSFDWHRQADIVTVFSQRHQARLEARLHRNTQVLPIEVPYTNSEPEALSGNSQNPRRVLIPAPVSEWHLPKTGLEMLCGFHKRNPNCEIHIMGGFGSWSANEKKQAWSQLEPIATHVHIIDDLNWTRFQTELDLADTLWLEPLAQESWRYLLSVMMGKERRLKMYLPSDWTPSLTHGSTANSLSRLYAGGH